MLQEALSFLYGRADENAKQLQARNLDWFPDNGRTFYHEHNQEVLKIELPPPLRDHVVHSVHDLITAVKKWSKPGVVWICWHSVVVVLDDEDRREFVTMPLQETQTFAVVKDLKYQMDQASLIRLLRREFKNAIGQMEALTAVRKIKFANNMSGFSSIDHGNESMGKQVEAEVTGAQNIPDSLRLPLFVYRGVKHDVEIDFDLSVDVHAQKFVLRPMPEEIDAAVDDTLLSLQQTIVDGVGKDVTVLFGTPTP